MSLEWAQDEMTEDNNSEVEQAATAATLQRAGSSADPEEGTPARERRYATRQATAAAQRSRHSYNPALDFEKVKPFPPISCHPPYCLYFGASMCSRPTMWNVGIIEKES